MSETAELSFVRLPFTKMQGLGNDFIIVEAQNLPEGKNLDQLEALAAQLSHRNFGIGSDGLIVVAPPSDPDKFDIQFIFYNSDGSRAEMCGNGIRCFARYIKERQILTQDSFRVETLAGLIQPQLNPDGTVTVDMGLPILEPSKIPFQPANPVNAHPLLNTSIIASGHTIPITPVSMGNPHCMIFQNDLPEHLNPAEFGPIIETHPQFPAKTNVEFVEIINRQTIRVTVWERGCGFTLACGTGACASAVASILLDKTDPEVEVQLPGGSLFIRWDKKQSEHVFMTGPAEAVFFGEIVLPMTTFFSGNVINLHTAVLS